MLQKRSNGVIVNEERVWGYSLSGEIDCGRVLTDDMERQQLARFMQSMHWYRPPLDFGPSLVERAMAWFGRLRKGAKA